MPFGAEDVQAAQRHHFVMFGAALLGKLIVERLPLVRRNLKDFALMLEENHGGGGLVIGARLTGGAVGTLAADYSRR